MQIELKQIQRDVGITFCFVTHDQEEALTISDRIAVFNDGRLEQVATPSALYEAPSTSFVAGFVGTSNLVTGGSAALLFGQEGTFSIRPEKIRVVTSGATGGSTNAVKASGVVREVVYLGSVNHYLVEVDGGSTLTVLRQNSSGQDTNGTGDPVIDRGQRVDLAWSDGHVIDLDTHGTAPAHQGEVE